MKKAPEAFRTISEVAEILETPAHVLRFWESKFYQIRPVKRAGGRRYYRPDDVALINGIRHLLQDQGMTIRGVQRILQEDGAKRVAALGGPLPNVASGIDAAMRVSIPDDHQDDHDDEVVAADLLPATALGPTPAESVAETATFAEYHDLTDHQMPVNRAADRAPGRATDDRALNDPVTADEKHGAKPQDSLDEGPSFPPISSVEDSMTETEDFATGYSDRADESTFASAPPNDVDLSFAAPDNAETFHLAANGDRLAHLLRSMPRGQLGAHRDPLERIGRRIDVLLERMSEASGAGRW